VVVFYTGDLNKVIISEKRGGIFLKKNQNLTRRMRQIMAGCAVHSQDAGGPRRWGVGGMGPKSQETAGKK
jgi:hypothetical protein